MKRACEFAERRRGRQFARIHTPARAVGSLDAQIDNSPALDIHHRNAGCEPSRRVTRAASREDVPVD